MSRSDVYRGVGLFSDLDRSQNVTHEQVQERPATAADLAQLEWPVERVIKPAKRRLRLRDLPGYAPLIRVLATRDLKVRYKQSVLGPIWLLFQPVALLVGFLVAFQGLANVETSGVPYVLFALVGLSVWAFFQSAMTIGTASIVTNANLIRYTPSPRSAFPIATIIASLPSFAVTTAAAFLATILAGHLSPRILLLPFILAWLLLLTVGTVALLSSLTVRYRDINSVLPFLLQVAVFLAPIGYPLGKLPPKATWLVNLNPITGVTEAMRWVMISGYEFAAKPICISLVVTPVIAFIGWRVFTRIETVMADDI
jgi:lipopolysaccharide transport system permease protein